MKKDSTNLPLSVASLFLSVLSLAIALVGNLHSDTAAGRNFLREQISVYLQNYTAVVKDAAPEVDPFSIEGYAHLKPPTQTQARITASLLVSVVDAMYQTDDIRACTWASYLAAMPGILSIKQIRFDKDYATDPRTAIAIAHARDPHVRLIATQRRACPND
jgi:hypothetical protein